MKHLESIKHILSKGDKKALRHASIKRHQESLKNIKDEIDDIFVDLLDDYSELEFSFKYDSLYKWIISNNEELGEYESKNYLYKMKDTLETIKGRLSDIGVECNYVLKDRKIIITISKSN